MRALLSGFPGAVLGDRRALTPARDQPQEKKTTKFPTLHLESAALLATTGQAAREAMSMAMVFSSFAPTYRETTKTARL